MPRLHQMERTLLSEIQHATAAVKPSIYRDYFRWWVEGKPPGFRHRVHSWYILSDLLDEAGLLPLARFMRTMPDIMPVLARWTNHDRYLRRHHPELLTRGGSYTPSPATNAFTNLDRARVELFSVLVSRPNTLNVYAFIPAERSLPADRRFAGGHRAFDARAAAVSYKTGHVGTWTNTPLGTCTTGKAWRDNMGGGRVPIDVAMKNGCQYHGHYYFTAGDYCRLKMVKADQGKVNLSDWTFPAWLNDPADSGPIPLPSVGDTE